jgi:putative transcriptional regulator
LQHCIQGYNWLNALGHNQEDFAARFHIAIGTLRDWEQGRAEPDQAARAY